LIAYLTSIARGSHIGRKHRKARLESFQGARFTKATHYLPLNGTTAARKLLDLRGNASGVPENGVKQSTADQIGYVLTLDGTDDFIELKNIKDQCIVDPSLCREGLSVAFWIKYNTGKFIISSGQYTDRNFGPGFRFICESCPKKKGPHLYRSRRFLLELSTINRKWTILLDHIPIWWFHFAFTWNHKRGLKFYKNGQLFVSSSNPETVVDGKGIANDLITIGKPNSLMDMYSTTGYGDLSIAHLVIWTYELTKFDVEIAFLSALTKTKNSLRCCQAMKDDPCFRDPCRGGVECQQMEDRFKCICSDVNLNRACLREQKLPEPCMDNSEVRCAALAAQDGYCENNRKRMSSICPKSCNFCASQSKTEPTSLPFDTALVPNASPGKENQQTSLSTPQVPTTSVALESEGGDDKGVSQSTLILIIGAAIGGLVLLVVLLVFILTRFYRQRKGEFVPDKTYPSSHSKQNGETGVEDVENISSFIDPSAPRITDVPHKPTRSQSSATGGAGGKKPKKPMGVKITYKPPKWD